MQSHSSISSRSPSSRNQRLSIIAEDGVAIPPIPARAFYRRASNNTSPILPTHNPVHYTNTRTQPSNRSQSRRWTDKPPHHSADTSPPIYEHFNDGSPRSVQSIFFEKIRENEQVARRGGWKRLVIVLVILLAVIVAIGTGLAVGLSKRNSNLPDTNNNGVNSQGDNTTTAFPAGSYVIPVYSAIASTDCTSIANTWRCYPYHTYDAANPSISRATYNWIITPADPTDSSSSSISNTTSYHISSTNNPFADMISNIPLTLESRGTPEEHYAFELPVLKIVIPTTSIAPAGQTTICYYNNTILRGTLYTSKPNLNISSSTGMSQSTMSGSNLASSPAASAGSDWKQWPYAVNVTQFISGGESVPDCYIMNSDKSQGDRITQGLTMQDAKKNCVCGYRNFGF